MRLKPIAYDENARPFDPLNPKFVFTWSYRDLKEQAERYRKRRNECLLDFLKGGFLDILQFDLSRNHLGGAMVNQNFYSECRRAIKESDDRYNQYVKDQKAKGVIFLEGTDTDYW